jgi:lipopolysaccharide transport system permease protein
VDFVVAFGVLVVLLAWYHIVPSAAVLTLPLWTLLAVTSAFAVGLWLSALNVRYRDVRYTLPFITQLWLCATPVAYSARLVPEFWRPLYALNPMVGVVDGFRWALLGQAPPSMAIVGVSTAATLVILVTGLYYFRRTERTFADLV